MSKLRLARTARGWSQAQAIHALAGAAAAEGRMIPGSDSIRIMLSRWENGHVQPDAVYRRYLRAAYRASDAELGFADDADGVAVNRCASMPVVSQGLLARFERTFCDLARSDNQLGAASVLAAAEADAHLLLRLAAQERGELRSAVLALASRFSELCGWLRQDAGDLERAQCWSDRALECATELGDNEQVSYVLMRKSNVATDAGQAARALGLAEAALRHEPLLTPQYRAAALRQLAWGHALVGDKSACLSAMERAREVVSSSQVVDTRASYVMPAYIGSEAGRCLLALGAPARAEPVLREALAGWPVDLPRDRALGLSRLTHSLAVVNEVDRSVECCRALVLRTTASLMLRPLSDKLRRHVDVLIGAMPGGRRQRRPGRTDLRRLLREVLPRRFRSSAP